MVWRPDMRTPGWGTPKINIGWSTPFRILYPPRINQDVHGPQTKVLVGWNERRYRRIRHPMWYLPMGYGGTSTTSRITPATAHSSMEVGRDQHGLHSWATQNTKWTRLNIGYSGPTSEGGTLYSSKGWLQRQQVGTAVHRQHTSITWSTKPNCLRQRNAIHSMILEKLTKSSRDTPGL